MNQKLAQTQGRKFRNKHSDLRPRVAEKDFEVTLWSQTSKIISREGKDSTVRYCSTDQYQCLVYLLYLRKQGPVPDSLQQKQPSVRMQTTEEAKTTGRKLWTPRVLHIRFLHWC